ncbi:response regulator transcription factor [Paractinoplanes durhamensis]|uniref:Sensory transduction protein n=1 Tax=Paractinoplanes durhamensis TaxID=113563 RepID=A0ABQ3YUW7_9ACTN|nr:response regulator transcription factor [Actinoplanes durhamensis]GIE01393.1 putative sensory transduction protein [Actinoplanes durhamensis]
MTAGAGRPASVHALVVDDEPALVRAVAGYLQRDGFTVTTAADGETALRAARAHEPDVVVLDLMLPGIDGIEVCRTLRTFTDAYVIMLTARADEVDKLIGLSVGADDYLTKPFSPRELVARIRTMLRRPRTATGGARDESVHRFGALTIDPVGREVRLGERVVDLTRTEFDLLAELAARPRQAFTRRQLIDAVWGGDWVGDEHLVDIHLGHTRRKLGDDPADPRYIRTVRGVGYRMGAG